MQTLAHDATADVRPVTTVTASNLASRAAGPDLLRALAILLVMLWHLPRTMTPGLLQPLKQLSWTGVDLFFVLSGYLIGTQLLSRRANGKPIDLPDFYLRRAFRILPAFLVVLALYLLLPDVREGSALQPTWRFLTFTMNFGLDFTVTGTFTQAWSLCVEEHFYLVFPLLVLLLSRLRWHGWAVVIASVILLGGMCLRAALWHEIMPVLIDEGRKARFAPEYLQAIYYPTYCRLDGLLIGVLLAAFRLFRPEHWRRYVQPRLALGVGALAISLAAMIFHYPATLGVGGPVLSLVGAVFGYPLFSFGCACILAASLEWERTFGTWRVPGAATIALLSYSIYLSHKLATHASMKLFGAQAVTGVQGFVIYFAAGIAGGALLWLVVERPFMRLRDRLIERRARRNEIVRS